MLGCLIQIFPEQAGVIVLIIDFRLNIAKELGFAVCNTGKETMAEKAGAYFGMAPSLTGQTMDADIFLDAAGDERILEQFMEHGKIGTRFVSVAVNNAKDN